MSHLASFLQILLLCTEHKVSIKASSGGTGVNQAPVRALSTVCMCMRVCVRVCYICKNVLAFVYMSMNMYRVK